MSLLRVGIPYMKLGNHGHGRKFGIRHVYILLGVVIGAIVTFFFFFELHIEAAVYTRKWVSDPVDTTPALSGCFTREDPLYNFTTNIWDKESTLDVHAGMEMRHGMDCYDFAGTIWARVDRGGHAPQDWTTDNELSIGQEKPVSKEERVVYHSYWRDDLAEFGERQETLLISFFATQPMHKSRFILWSNGDLSRNPIIHRYATRYPDMFETKRADVPVLVQGTALEGSKNLGLKDSRGWVDSDLVRLLVLWHYGGVWIDMDFLLTRSLEPLLEHEFLQQWDCFSRPSPMNGALIRFLKHSPYLCEAFHIMASDPPPKTDTINWGAHMYIKLWKRLVKAGIPPFKVLPWCFVDGRACKTNNRLPNPFEQDGSGDSRWIPTKESYKDLASTDRVMSMEEGGLLDEVLHKVFAVHLHNQYQKMFPENGWVDRLLLKRFERHIKRLDAHLVQSREAESG